MTAFEAGQCGRQGGSVAMESLGTDIPLYPTRPQPTTNAGRTALNGPPPTSSSHSRQGTGHRLYCTVPNQPLWSPDTFLQCEMFCPGVYTPRAPRILRCVQSAIHFGLHSQAIECFWGAFSEDQLSKYFFLRFCCPPTVMNSSVVGWSVIPSTLFVYQPDVSDLN